MHLYTAYHDSNGGHDAERRADRHQNQTKNPHGYGYLAVNRERDRESVCVTECSTNPDYMVGLTNKRKPDTGKSKFVESSFLIPI